MQVTVLDSETKSGISKKGSAYSMVVAQVAVQLEDGKVIAGELVLPKGHAEVKAGKYAATFQFGKGLDGKVVAYVKALTPIAVSSAKVA